MIGFWIGDNQLLQIKGPSYIDPLQHGFTDVLLVCYNVNSATLPAKMQLWKQWCAWVGERGKIWLVLHGDAKPLGAPQANGLGDVGDMMRETGEPYRPFIDEAGSVDTTMICPTWAAYWRWQIERARRVSSFAAAQPNIAGILWDLECYRAAGEHRYTSRCGCAHSGRIGDQKVYVRNMAEALGDAIDHRLQVGLVAANWLDNDDKPIPFCAGFLAGLSNMRSEEPLLLVESTYPTGWQPIDVGQKPCYAVLQETWDCRTICGIDPNRIPASDWAWHVNALRTHADGLFTYHPPYVHRQDDAAALATYRAFETFLPDSRSYRKWPSGNYEYETYNHNGMIERRMVQT